MSVRVSCRVAEISRRFAPPNARNPSDTTLTPACGSGAELIWSFVSEADPSSGQVNCAVEPPRSNALARVLFQNNC
jgi:hypothetical protein